MNWFNQVSFKLLTNKDVSLNVTAAVNSYLF